MSNVLEEYLVKLGSVVDQSSMHQFHQALGQANLVAQNTAKSIGGSFGALGDAVGGIGEAIGAEFGEMGLAAELVFEKIKQAVEAVVKFETAAVGGFTAIGFAAIGMADKVAMADQSYRLLAMRMFTTKETARSLQMTMNALGVSLEEIAWDPEFELQPRVARSFDLQRNMSPNGDFDAQMKRIRDIRAEFGYMEIEVQYLGMHVVQDFLKALGTSPEKLLTTLREFNDRVSTHLPAISSVLVEDFLPVWRDVEKVLGAVGHAALTVGTAFTNVMAALTGDQGLRAASFDSEKFARALVKVADLIASIAIGIANIVDYLAEAVNLATSLTSGGGFSQWQREFNFGASTGDATGGSGDATGGSGDWFKAVFGSKISERAATGAQHDLVEQTALRYGVDPGLAHAIAMQESGESQYNADGSVKRNPFSTATGTMQLLAGTAKDLGVDPNDPKQNVDGGIRRLKDLLSTHTVPEAIAGFFLGETELRAVMSGKTTTHSANGIAYTRSVLQAMGQHGTVHIGTLQVNVDKGSNVNEHHVGQAIGLAIAEQQRKAALATQRNLYQLGSAGY